MANNAVTVADLEIVISYRNKNNPEKQIAKTTQALNSVKASAKGATKSTNNFLSSIVRIAKYRILRTIIKEISAAFKEGTTNLLEWEKATGNRRYINTMSEVSGQLLQLKNALGASLLPLLQIMQPVINAVSNGFIYFANAINQVLSALLGYSTYMKANTISNYDYAKSLSKVKNQLLGFDELNVLQDNSTTSGGIEYKDMFTIQGVSATIKSELNEILLLVGLIGSGILAWKLSSVLPVSFTELFGILTTIVGAVGLVRSIVDQLDKGITFDNLKDAFMSVLVLTTGLTIATGSLQAAFSGLTIGGIMMLLPVIKELITTGTLSAEAFNQLRTSIALLAVGLAPLTGGWSLLVGAIGIGATLVIEHWEEIKAAFFKVVDEIKQKIQAVIDWYKSTELYSWLHGEKSQTYKDIRTNEGLGFGLGYGYKYGGNFASGGIPAQGSMFIAGETGDPEFVGNVGGRTSVYNSDQLAGSLASANENVVNAIFQAVNSINAAIANQPTPSIKIGDREIYRAAERGRTIAGQSLVQGAR